MKANYHVHTYRCKHAIGKDEEYIQKAIAEGIKILGFSDHAPYIYPNGYVSYYKMTPDEIPEYFASISALKEKYADQIKIHIGYEAEYYPELWDETFKFWKNGNRPEYLILGQHFVTEEYIKDLVHSQSGTDDEKMLRRYVDTVITAINTGKFTYIAHPDVLNFKGDRELFRCEMERLIKSAAEIDIPLEINLLGLAEKRNYPCNDFWKIASRYEPRVVLGFDAHEPWRVADKKEIAEAVSYAKGYKLNIIDEIELIDPFEEEI